MPDGFKTGALPGRHVRVFVSSKSQGLVGDAEFALPIERP